MVSHNAGDIPKYRQISQELQRQIASGVYGRGDRLPGELDLALRFATSRVTVAKAIRELQEKGLVDRRAGSGTFVRERPPRSSTSYVFGLLIPDLGRTEIFEPICQGMINCPMASAHSLLWSHAEAEGKEIEEQTEQLCHNFIAKRVSGVFFAPLEFTPRRDAVNARVAQALREAQVATVLLDRSIAPYPRRSPHDLVGIDNRRAAHILTEHLQKLGNSRIAFLSRPHSASTVEERIAGYREALMSAGERPAAELVWSGDPEDAAFVQARMEAVRPCAIVCANDQTAANLMLTLNILGWHVPEDVRVVGIDDVKYARFLPVPLTTQHQPCGEIGAVAMATMLERLEHPELPTRDILLNCKLVVRKSCGGGAGPRAGVQREAE